MTDQSWLNLLTLLLALGTFALVAVTGWSTRKLVHEGRATRREERVEERRALVRASVAEGVENARAWMAIQPRRLTLGEAQRRVPHPQFSSLSSLIDKMDLPGDVVAYLLWARGFIPELRDRYASCIATADGSGDPARAVNECRGVWEAALDLLQSEALLVRAYAAADPELAPAMSGFTPGRWLVAQPGPPQARELEHAQRMAMDGAPAWPAGQAYAAWSPVSRDIEAAHTGQKQQDDLHSALDGVGRRAATGAASES